MMNRRIFISKTAAATVGLAAALPTRARAQKSPNDTVNVAIIGLRGATPVIRRGPSAAAGSITTSISPASRTSASATSSTSTSATSGFTVVYAKDKWGGDPKTETDFRRVLDNRDVDAVTIAAPDHWHALMTIWACQAGKDVYVEKPISHNIVEGRRMIEAARRIQPRRAGGHAEAQRRCSRQGRTVRPRWRPRHNPHGKTVIYRSRIPSASWRTAPPRPSVHYDLWLGPAPARPFNENHFHYHWHWFWEYGTGDLGNTGVHSLDAVRWLLGKQEHPKTAHCMAACTKSGAPTDQTTPNTQYATYQYADGTELHCDLRNWFADRPRRRVFSFSAPRAG